MTEETQTPETKSLKTWMYALSAVCLVLLISSVYMLIKTADSKNSGPTKIGYVRSEQLLQQYKPALAIQQRLQQESAEAQKDLEKRYKELQMMDADIKKKSEVLTMQALSPQIEKMQRKQNEFLQLQQSIQQSVQQKQSALLEPVFQDVSNFINKYGRDKGYAVIFGTPVEGIVVYGDPASDLTETIVTELNARIPPTLPIPYNSGTDSTK
jgi:outer membrane protein